MPIGFTKPSGRRGDNGHVALGLDKAIAGMVLGVALLGLATWGALGELGRQVNRWGAIEVVDEARQDLSRTIGRIGPLPDPEDQARVLDAFDALADRIDRLHEIDEGNSFSATAAQITRQAREAFTVAAEQGQASVVSLTVLEQDLDRLTEIVAGETEEARLELGKATSTAAGLEQDQRAISERLHALFGALVSAEKVRRQVESFTRFNASPQGQQSPLQAIRIDLEGFPRPCTAENEDDPGMVCKPFPGRLRNAVAAIVEAGPEDLQVAAQAGVLAAEAYVRAAETRYHALTDELQSRADALSEERQHTADLRRREIAISRVNRSLNDTRMIVKSLPQAGVEELSELDARVRGLIPQIQMRLRGVIAETDADPARVETVNALVDRIKAEWATAQTAARAATIARQEFEEDLNRLGRTIIDTTGTVRASAGRWIGVFSNSTLSIFGLLAFLVLLAAAVVRQHVMRPLAVVTGAILGLAQGRMDTPLVLTSGGAGFRKLAEATETLRRANIERRDLLARNAQQKLQIERQMAQLEATARKIEHQARHDALTGLGNRRFADDFLNDLQVEAEPEQVDFALLHVDVDRFKEINDTIGHDAGDFILKRVAEVLTAHAGPGDHTFRIGGDEFLVVLTDAGDRARVETLAADLVGAMAEPVEFDGHSCRVGGSIGIAFGRDAGFDCRATLVNADMALYRAKNEGRNRYAFFNEELQRQMVRTKKLSDEIFLAVERSEFVPFYQPQFHGGSLALRGVEMLCRWQHPELGLIGPGAFLETAQDLKLVGQIDRLLFEQAARDMTELKARGILIPKISFNVTADRLLHQDLARSLRETVDPDIDIALELLESMSLDTVSEALRWSIDTLKENEIGIEIDDFGSCRASIAGLISVGPDAMKIDRAIVSPITRSEPHLRLTQAIVDIGHTLGIEVVAEGVETEEHVDLLGRIGCAVLQGFALARPMSRDDLETFLSKRAGRPDYAA